MKPLDVICLIACGLLLLQPPSPSVLDECHMTDVTSKVDILRQMARIDFDSKEAAGDWWNQSATEQRIEDFTPFTDAVAEAIFADDAKAALNTLADKLEGK